MRTWKFVGSRVHNQQKLPLYVAHIGDRIVTDGDKYDVLVNWSILDDPPHLRGAINGNILSIRKDVVDRYFSECFGYSSFVDPEKHIGFAVLKNTQQCTHSGKYVKCPRKADAMEYEANGIMQRWFYQVAVDNRIWGDLPPHKQEYQLVRDYRFSCLFGDVVCIWIKDKTQANAFYPFNRAEPEKVRLIYDDEIQEHFTKDELHRVRRFLKKMNIDFADLDVVRDNSTGRMYIIDVNNIPNAGLFRKLSTQHRLDSLELHRRAIDANVANFVR